MVAVVAAVVVVEDHEEVAGAACHAPRVAEEEGGAVPNLRVVGVAAGPSLLAAVVVSQDRLVAVAVPPGPQVGGVHPDRREDLVRQVGAPNLRVADPGLPAAEISLVHPVADLVLQGATVSPPGRARDPLAGIPGPVAGVCPRSPLVVVAAWPTVLQVGTASRSCPQAAAPEERVQELTGLPSSPPGLVWRIVPVSFRPVQVLVQETALRNCRLVPERAIARQSVVARPNCQRVLVRVIVRVQGTDLLSYPPARVDPEGPSVRETSADRGLPALCRPSDPARVTWVISSVSPRVRVQVPPSRSFPPLKEAASVPRNSRRVALGTDVPASATAQASVEDPLAKGPASESVQEICQRVPNGLKTGPTGETGRRIAEKTGRTG